MQHARRKEPTMGLTTGNRERTVRCESTWCADHRCNTPSDMLTGQPKRACLSREVHGQRGDGRNRKLRWETSLDAEAENASHDRSHAQAVCLNMKRCGREPEQLSSEVTQQTRQRGSSFQQQCHMDSGTGQSREPRSSKRTVRQQTTSRTARQTVENNEKSQQL